MEAAVTRVRCLAPAKLNLFLHVTGRRADGFHDLETVFQLVDLCDELTIAVRSDGRICRNPLPDDPLLAQLSDDADLTVRAARLLQQASGCALGADIHVHKRIPAGGGMGGGSSDAAAVLRTLNQLWQLHWPVQELAALSLSLGSDVPVFVQGRNAFASGRGEVLTPIELPQRWFVIVHPPVAISTAQIFGDPQLTRDTPPLKIRALPPDGGRNDCETVVCERYPQVAEVLEHLAPYEARLTGTGACVFTHFATRSEADRVVATLPTAWQVFVARGMDAIPS